MQKEYRPLLGEKGISGSTLKLIAVLTMLIDHVGAVIVERWLLWDAAASNPYAFHPRVYLLDQVLRSVGRLSFPIFCFLLVEGFSHTGNLKKYLLRLLGFALLSEIPFDLAFAGTAVSLKYQNVYFTLFIGVAAIGGMEKIKSRMQMGKIRKIVLCLILLVAGLFLGEVLRTDYGAKGVFSIVVLYLLRYSGLWQMVGGGATFLWELPASLAFLPIAAYNGKRGWKLKYIFYIFYPVHLLVLYGIASFMGIA